MRQQVGILLGQDGDEIIEAGDGNEGITAIASHPNITIVISDVYMPNMDGLEMVSTQKSDPANGSLPIIILTTTDRRLTLGKPRKSGRLAELSNPLTQINRLQLLKTLRVVN